MHMLHTGNHGVCHAVTIDALRVEVFTAKTKKTKFITSLLCSCESHDIETAQVQSGLV